ncbi:MAG: GNAT family N-acetyltransferase [Bacteroidetes bacterium]|nr:GNAT family N-acetyltransferase [Bacteroidota bacterium]
MKKLTNVLPGPLLLKVTNQLVGNICLWNLKPEHYRAEIGYTLLPEFHRQGIMNEAVEEVVKYAFQTLNLHSIEGHVNSMNEGSVKILERNNFVREGYFRENQYYNGKFYDTAVYTLFNKIS